MGHFRSINILTWFQDKLLYLVLFSLYPSLFWELRAGQKELKKFTILTRKPRSQVRILIYRKWPIQAPTEFTSPKPYYY